MEPKWGPQNYERAWAPQNAESDPGTRRYHSTRNNKNLKFL